MVGKRCLSKLSSTIAIQHCSCVTPRNAQIVHWRQKQHFMISDQMQMNTKYREKMLSRSLLLKVTIFFFLSIDKKRQLETYFDDPLQSVLTKVDEKGFVC